MVGFGQRNPHHCYDLLEHTLHALDAVPPEESLRFAALLHDVGKPDCFSLDEDGVGHFYGHAARSAALADAMLVRLRAGNALREEVTELIRRHDTPLPGCPEATLRRLLRRLGEERLRRMHIHFSKIEYSAGGEKRHLTFGDTVYGPEPAPLMTLLAERGMTPTVICESAGTQTADAAQMQSLYRAAAARVSAENRHK